MTPDVKQIIGFAVLGLLLVKHSEAVEANRETSTNYAAESDNEETSGKNAVENETGVNYNDILLADACAYGVFVLFAIIREYLSGAVIFGYELTSIPVVSATFGKPMFGLILAGLAIAVLNRVLKTKSVKNAAL